MESPAIKARSAGVEAGTYQPLVVVLAAACAGIVVDRFGGWPFAAWWLTAAVALLVWWRLWRRALDRWALAPLLISLAAIGGAWHHCGWHLFGGDDLGFFAREEGQPVCIDGWAVSGPRRLASPPYDPLRTIPVGDRSRLEIELAGIRDGDRWRKASGCATFVVEGHLLGVQAGDRLRIFGKLYAARGPDNPGEFDYAQHARADRQLCSLRASFPECVTRSAAARGWSPWRAIDQLRSQGDALLWQHLSHERSGLAAAMFLGVREELQADESQAFMETGTIHLLVVSGLNVGILAMFLHFGMRSGLVPRSVSLAALIVLTLLYAAVTDLQPPVVRATVMVVVVCAAYWLGRRALAFNSLAAAAFVVLLLNPAELFRVGTQLSFLSVAALCWTAQTYFSRRELDSLDRLIARTRPWPVRAVRRCTSGIWQAALVSTVIWLVVLPLIMTRFHLVSPVAVVLGPLLSLPVTLSMLSGLGVLLLGWLAPPLGAMFGWFCDKNLAVLEYCVSAGRQMPLSHQWVSGPGDWWLAGFYGGLALCVFSPRLRPPRRWCLALLALWMALGLGGSWPNARGPNRLDCTFLSVGHGLAVVLELPGGQTLLYDAGRLGSPIAPARSIAGFLWSRGITHLDAVVLSHADADHYNALPQLLNQFSVGAVYVSTVMWDDTHGAVGALQQAIRRSGVPLREVWSGDRLKTHGDCRIEVLHPPRRGVIGSDNANSIVLAVECQGRRILLTGDLAAPGLNDLLAEEPLDCDVVLAPHHGSRFSDPPGFAKWSTPEWVIMSSAERDRTESVTQAYARRGGQVLHTSTEGAVHLAIDEGQITVDTWRGGKWPVAVIGGQSN